MSEGNVSGPSFSEAQELARNAYLPYPHSNGFADGGSTLFLGRLHEDRAEVVKLCLTSGKEETVCAFPRADEPEKLLWFDVAPGRNRMAVVAQGALWLCDGDSPKLLYRPDPPAETCSTLPSISADGRRVLTGLRLSGRFVLLEVDAVTGSARELCEKAWWINHAHFCPFDENWIGFCHEGACDTVSDRLWGWHAREAPSGRCLFGQGWEEESTTLFIGHERWCFHDRAAMVVAYGASPGGPRGIYEVNAAGRVRLVSPGDRDWHVNVSSSGRWAVVDTSGPHDRPGKGWEQAEGISDILLIDRQSGERRWLARSHLAARHPWHPHPVFSSDERTIYFNEVLPGGGRVMQVRNPWFS